MRSISSFITPSFSVSLLAITVAVFFASCGSTSKVVKDYTPLASISGLEQDKSKAPTLVYTRPGARALADYDKFMIGSVTVDNRNGDAEKLDQKDVERVQNYLTEQITKELKDGGYQVVSEASKGTVEMSFLLSGISTPKAGANVTQIVFPLTISVGGITVEGTFKDATSDQIDAVVISSSQGGRWFNATPWSTWADVESSLDKWAKGIRKSVEEGRGK